MDKTILGNEHTCLKRRLRRGRSSGPIALATKERRTETIIDASSVSGDMIRYVQ